MKKYFVLTSLLTLTACFGGGGSGVSNPGEIRKPSSAEVTSDNAIVTGVIGRTKNQMAEETLTKSGYVIPNEAEKKMLSKSTRNAFVPSQPTGNTKYDIALELVNLAGWLADETTTDADIKEMFDKSDDDRNKIQAALKLIDAESYFVSESAQGTADNIVSHKSEFKKPLLQLQLDTEILDLEKVTFKSIPTSGVIADLVFHTDENGIIKSIEFPDAKDIEALGEGIDVPQGELKRKDKTNVFIATAQNFDEDSKDKTEIPITYISRTRDLGLRYAEFGILETDFSVVGSEVYNTPFIGGHDVKRIDIKEDELAGDIVFHGIAEGTVSYNDGNGDKALAGGLSDKNATLTFAKEGGTQTLAANFENWANIRAVKTKAGDQFVVEKWNQEGKPEYDPYKLTTSPVLQDGKMPGEDQEHPNDNMIMQTGYYGDNNVPSEAVGLVQYQHVKDGHHVNVDLGFGGKIEK